MRRHRHASEVRSLTVAAPFELSVCGGCASIRELRLAIVQGTVAMNRGMETDRQAYRLKIADGSIEVTGNDAPARETTVTCKPGLRPGSVTKLCVRMRTS